MVITANEIDILKELMNIGIGKGAEVLNTMLHSHVKLSVPNLQIVRPSDLSSAVTENYEGEFSAVTMKFDGNFSGKAGLLFTTDAAEKLIAAVTGTKVLHYNEMDAIKSGTLVEIGNIVMNAIIGSISNMYNFTLVYTVPDYVEGQFNDMYTSDEIDDSVILIARTKFNIESLEIQGDILIFFTIESFDTILARIGNG
jgi:chemotaxis protein CheC